jgi:hypothetical protein
MPKRKQPGLYPTPQKKAEFELRRYQMLELYKGGATEKQIGEALGVDRSQVHRSIKRVLNDLAVKYSGMADQIRALQMERYTTLLARWWPQALNADETATKMVMSIMHRISEINGVIPKEPLITIDHRAIHLTQGEVTFSIEAASGNYLNGNGPDGDVPETQSLPEATGGDIQP